MVNIINDFKYIYTVEVTGSNPVPPTNKNNTLRSITLIGLFV